MNEAGQPHSENEDKIPHVSSAVETAGTVVVLHQKSRARTCQAEVKRVRTQRRHARALTLSKLLVSFKTAVSVVTWTAICARIRGMWSVAEAEADGGGREGGTHLRVGALGDVAAAVSEGETGRPP